MPRFIVHAGGHKTGTTAYQTWLQAYQAALFEAGYFVPTELTAPHINHRPVIEALAGVRRGNAADPATIVAAMDRLLRDRPSHDVLISSEYLARAEGRVLIPALARAIARHGYEPHAILAVRDQGPAFCSWFMQERKVMRANGDFAHFVDDRVARRLCDWSYLADAFEAEGFTVHALAYDQDAKAAGIVAAINALPLFDRGDLPADTPDAYNESVGILGGIVTDIVRSAAEADGVRLVQAIRLHLHDMIFDRWLLLDDCPFNGLTPAIATQLDRAYSASNAAFATRYLGRSWDAIFPAVVIPGSPSPESIDRLEPAQALAVRHMADSVIAEARAVHWFRHLRQPQRGDAKDSDRP